MNQQQLESLLRILLATGGPVAGLLTNWGVATGDVNNWLTIALIVLPPLGSAIWGYVRNTDHSTIAAASKVEGVNVIEISPNAINGAARAANDPALQNVGVKP